MVMLCKVVILNDDDNFEGEQRVMVLTFDTCTIVEWSSPGDTV
jgi:hypothetical protein